MGIFGGSGDTGSSDYGSKLRTPSYSTELDLSSDPSGNAGLGRSTLDMAGGDLEAGLQIEQGKAQLMSQVINGPKKVKKLKMSSKMSNKSSLILVKIWSQIIKNG